MGSVFSQPNGYPGYIAQNIKTNQVPSLYTGNQPIDITFPKECIVNSLVYDNTSDTIGVNDLKNTVEQCMLVNGVPVSGLNQMGSNQNRIGMGSPLGSSPLGSSPMSMASKEGFDEPFAGFSQSLDGRSLCVNYTALFWIAIIIIFIVIFVMYKHSHNPIL